MKKLLTFNIIIISLIFTANMGSFYAINYPVKFNFLYDFKDYGLEFILITFLVIALVTALVSSLNIKNLDFKSKFLGIFAFLNLIFLTFLVSASVIVYNQKKKDYIKLENEYVKQAKLDIRNDNVIYKYAGGFAIAECNQNIENKIDSINKKYGIKYNDTGCIIMNNHIKAEEKYAEVVKPYLEKRNGKNWEQKMENEIKHMKENCK